ncbi:LOG family protein [Candidatus Woesearchaeota archaeon]|nr:LOG family protein [Candidatus Woesearchaeota archaeon]USN44674.1 MAG: LOG family protein [Candidatus Woesearchaeota archaeon]
MKKKESPLIYLQKDFMQSESARPLRLIAEYIGPHEKFAELGIKHSIIFYGSARIPPKNNQSSKYYTQAVDLSKKLAKYLLDSKENKDTTIVTGGGPGIMEAASKGTKLGGIKSIGLNISLPHEQEVNPYVLHEHSFEFHYFFMRKYWLLEYARVLIFFPGGFGTFDELFGVLTLIQTRKLERHIKVILYDEEHWTQTVNFKRLIEMGLISKKEFQCIEFAKDAQQAYESTVQFLNKKKKSKGNF